METNLITKAVGEILDGRYFIIPSYQRGYRWKGKQVEDLLNDLYSFAIKPEHQEREFYCLQPIIVQKLSDEDKGKYNCPQEKEAWEVVDGQQRLTTIYILLNYIIKKRLRIDEETFKEDYDKELFHLKYETRDNSDEFFTQMDVNISDTDNIDYAYIINAYNHIDEWFTSENGARKIYERLPEDKRPGQSSVKKFAESILNVLLNSKGAKDPSAQFIWYQLGNDEGVHTKKNAIEEFVRINNGKIALTNAELIKALFLQKKNFSAGDEDLKQIQIAIEWEQMENELHKDDFWYYIRKKESKKDDFIANRIDYLFSIEYKSSNWDVSSIDEEEDAKNNLKRLNDELSDKDRLFRFYNDKFEGLSEAELSAKIKAEWANILKCFRTLQDWYNDSEIYNYIGYLSQCGYDMARIYYRYAAMEDNQVRADFIEYLQGLVKKSLSSIWINPSDDPEFPNGIINISYKQRSDVYNALLFLNVNLLNERIVNMRKRKDVALLDEIEITLNSSIYKFPFDIFVGQNWDIEHIDSFTTNPLKSTDDQRKWLETELNGLDNTLLSVEQRSTIEKMIEEGSYKEAIDKLRKTVDSEEDAADEDEEEKNSIGNLTLLDNVTNRQYHNDLFVLKRAKIMSRLKDGIFVPSTTLYAFAKLYDENPKKLSKWMHSDKVAYHNFIIDSLKGYIGG
jgi:uncharacterized protein with ParB-like and HNH nuclease domain